MAMINAVYFGMDGLPSFDGQVPIRRINTSDLKAAQAEALRADAANKRANTETEDKSRDIFIENMKQSGVSTWLENIVKKVRCKEYPKRTKLQQ